MQDVQHAEHVPDFVVRGQILNLVWGLVGQIGAVLGKRLELIDELVDELPEPLIRQLQLHRRVRMQDVVEEIAVIVKGVEPLLQRGALHARVYVTVVELLVEGEEDRVVVDEVGDRRGVRPRRLVEQLLRDFGERVLIEILDLEDHALVDAVAQEHEEVAYHLGHLPVARPLVLVVRLWRPIVVVGVILRGKRT